MRFPLLLPLFFALHAGCDSDPDTGTAAVEAPTVPMEGEWHLAPGGTIYEDGCDYLDDGSGSWSPESQTDIVMTGETTFEMTRFERVTYTCTLEGGPDFSCDMLISETDYSQYTSYNAVVTVESRYSGQFTAEDAGAFTFEETLTCAGEDCADLSAWIYTPYPCSSHATTTIEYSG